MILSVAGHGTRVDLTTMRSLSFVDVRRRSILYVIDRCLSALSMRTGALGDMIDDETTDHRRRSWAN